MEEKINELNEKLEGKSKSLAAEEINRKELEEEVKNMRNNYTELVKASESNKKELKEEITKKETFIKEQKSQIEKLNTELEHKGKGIIKLELDKEELNKTINNLKGQWEQQKKEFKKEISELKDQWINYRKMKKAIFNFSVTLSKEIDLEEYKIDIIENETELESFFKYIVKIIRQLKLKLTETEKKFKNEKEVHERYREEAAEDYNELEKEVLIQNKHIKKMEKAHEEVQYKCSLLEHEASLNQDLIKGYKNEQSSLKQKLEENEINVKSYIQNISEQKVIKLKYLI